MEKKANSYHRSQIDNSRKIIGVANFKYKKNKVVSCWEKLQAKLQNSLNVFIRKDIKFQRTVEDILDEKLELTVKKTYLRSLQI